MSNYIYQSIFHEEADKFLRSFNVYSRERGTDPKTGKLHHAPMFGANRESICIDFFKLLCPQGTELANRVKIITPFEKCSTECDIIAYDFYNTPFLKSASVQYFPIECVKGIIEVKSRLSKADFKDALLKLANNKALRQDLASFPFSKRGDMGAVQHYNVSNPIDQIFTLLICEKLEFDIKSLNFDSIYAGIANNLRHNLILSLNDGLFFYQNPDDGVYNPWPCNVNGVLGEIQFHELVTSKHTSVMEVLYHFAQLFNLVLRCSTVLDLEIIRYLHAAPE